MVPQRLRKALHGVAGTQRRVSECGQGLLLEPVLVVRDGVKLLGRPLTDSSPGVTDARENRLDELASRAARPADAVSCVDAELR